MEIYLETKGFPPDERYSLTDQMRRSSRSVAANIAEAYRKRQYEKMFLSKMADADAEASETLLWIDFACDCGYISRARREDWAARFEQVGKMLVAIIANPAKFLLSKSE